MLSTPVAFAGTFETLHQFTGVADGAAPFGGFVMDKSYTLYAATYSGGNFDQNHCGGGCGTIFSIDTASGKFTTLHKFTEAEGLGVDGPLTSDGGQTLYGATSYGGPGVTGGGGVVYQFDVPSKTVSILYTLKGDNGAISCPVTGLALAKGGLYGGAFCGGPGNFGGVYRVDIASKTLKVVYAYNGSLGCKTCGEYMNSNMIVGKDGLLYGGTLSGSTFGRGALFRINPGSNTTVGLHAFHDTDGGGLSGPLTVGADGMLYGTTAQGNSAHGNCGETGCGALFMFDPVKLKLTVLHYFTGKTDGGLPGGTTALTTNGKALYGETSYGGAHSHGTLYKIDLATNKLTVAHAFTGGADGGGSDGTQPALKFARGKLFGSAGSGGKKGTCNSAGCGTIFRFTL
jgi:uncharacterized repeat protein (TIGR03803 family)